MELLGFKALDKHMRKSTQAFSSRSTCVPFGHLLLTWLASTWVDLRRLAWTLIELKFVHKSTQVFPLLATQRKSAQVDHKSSVNAWNLRPFATCVNLRADLRIRLATLRKSVCKFWFCKLASTCESVWPFGQDNLYSRLVFLRFLQPTFARWRVWGRHPFDEAAAR